MKRLLRYGRWYGAKYKVHELENNVQQPIKLDNLIKIESKVKSFDGGMKARYSVRYRV